MLPIAGSLAGRMSANDILLHLIEQSLLLHIYRVATPRVSRNGAKLSQCVDSMSPHELMDIKAFRNTFLSFFQIHASLSFLNIGLLRALLSKPWFTAANSSLKQQNPLWCGVFYRALQLKPTHSISSHWTNSWVGVNSLSLPCTWIFTCCVQ